MGWQVSSASVADVVLRLVGADENYNAYLSPSHTGWLADTGLMDALVTQVRLGHPGTRQPAHWLPPHSRRIRVTGASGEETQGLHWPSAGLEDRACCTASCALKEGCENCCSGPAGLL